MPSARKTRVKIASALILLENRKIIESKQDVKLILRMRNTVEMKKVVTLQRSPDPKLLRQRMLPFHDKGSN
jgi:hypothetical protein